MLISATGPSVDQNGRQQILPKMLLTMTHRRLCEHFGDALGLVIDQNDGLSVVGPRGRDPFGCHCS